MENIFLNTDWHLYSKKHESHHPYRSRLDLALLHDNIGEDMTENDLWVYLGDLCDPEVANRDMIRRILETIPAHKVLVRGNRDTEEDQWYLDLGFNQVTEGLIIHNMLFTHKPQPVPMDWINIHGDLHFEQIAMDGTHINAFASNWNDACHPVLLDDLIRGAKVQKLQLPKFKSDKYQARFHEDLETPSVTKFLDLTDAFQLYPMDEGISKLVGKGQLVWKTPAELKDWMHEHVEYNPEETNWKLRSPNEVLRDCRGNCHDQAYFAKRYLDLLGLDTYLIFLVEYAGPIVRNAGKTHTLVAYRDDHGKYYWFENAWGDESGINGPYNSLNALKQDVKKCWVKRPEYPKLYCGDATPIDHYGMDLNDYVEWNLPDRLLGETTTLAEAILFPDVETTKYFEADDNEYKRKAQKAEVDQDGNTAVTLDESDEAYGERIVAEQHQKLVEKVNGLAESLAESAKITKKQSNRSGPYQLFDMSLGYQKEPRYAAVLTEDILTSFMDVRPEDLDKDRIQSMTSSKELEDMFKEFAKSATSDISEDGYTTTAQILAIALSHGLDTGDLIPKLDADAFIKYRDRRLRELEQIEQMFIGVLLENYRRIGLSKAECDKLVSSSNTAKVIKQLKAAAKKHVKPNYSKDGTVEFDYQLFGRGKVYVAPNAFRGKLPNVGNMLKRALEYDYVIIGHGTDNNGHWVLDPAMTIDGTAFTDVSALVKHLKKQKPGAKILLAVCNTGHIEPVGSEWEDVRYSSYMTLFESAVPKADPLYDRFVHYDQLISALAVARNRMISVIKDADVYATGKGSIELLEIVPKTFGVHLSAYSKKLRDPKDFTKAAIDAINSTSDMCYRMLRIARSVVQYMIKPTNESAFMWTNSTTLPLIGANVGLYHNVANLGFDTVDECLSDALDHIGYELITGGQRIAEPAIEIYDMSGNHVAEYNYDGLMEAALLEGVQASSIEPNHKQNGHINLSHLKRVDVTKAYLAKRGKKGVLKDASPCTNTCKTVAWELDGRPIVTVAVGYQDKDCNWIGNMEVDPEFRGYGLGAQALKYAVDELGGDALAVFKANKLAIQIYKDHGFVLKNPDEFKNEDYVQMVLDEAIATTASLDRGQKEDVADRYGLRDVGNTHEQEDRLQAELDAYKRKKAPTKAQLAKKREQDRLRYLKKARRVRKRKSVLRKIKKAFFPGVKNEAVDTVDNVDTESREIAEIRQEDTFGGDRKRYFDNKLQYANASEADDGPVIIEAVNPVRFFDRINEADTDIPRRSPIFVVSIADGAGLRIMMIGFSSNLKPAYALSFTENGTRARVLSVDNGRALTATGKTSRTLTLALGTDDQSKALRSRLDYYAQNRTKLKTEGPKDPAMVVAGLLGIGDLPESYPLGEMDADYDPADIDRQVKSILGQKRIQERLEEGAIMNLHRSNPWQDQILEYQLGLVDEESFVAYLEKPKRIIRVDHSQINEPDYKEQNLEFKKRTKGKNYEANEIQRYHTIIGDAETV